MMKKGLLVALLLVVLPVYASHIVGGEFELIYISGYTYRLNMILYFDDLHGNPGALDQSATVSFYRKSDNMFMASLILPLLSREPVSYTQPACSSGFLETDKLFYSASIELSPDVYNDPQGYYISWQRCCRNYDITNIVSDDPQLGGEAAGQTFYLEFPPVIKNGIQFINSSPHLFPPLSDYACPGRPYYVNFTGVDDDNDSIVYSLTTPLNTTSGFSIPAPSPRPYPLIKWRTGYDSLHIMGGSPDLGISRDGLLTCTPVNEGLFVFAIKAEEYRDGVKIGETRRDFQMLVVNGCEPDQPPQITGKKLTDASFSYVGNMSVSFAGTVANSDRCIMVRVADPDSQDPAHNNTENISIKVVPLNFKRKSLNGILPSVISATLVNGSTHDFMICFPECPILKTPFQIGVIALDDACSLPMTDTLKITVDQQMLPNTSAYFLPQKDTTVQLLEGSSGSWPYTAKDDDGDKLTISLITDGFTLNSAGMTFKILNQQPGSVNGTLDWNAFCKNFEFSKKSDFIVKVLVDDQDVCKVIHFDTAVFNLKVILPDIHPHLEIYNDVSAQQVTSSTITMNLGHLGLNVIGTDTDVTPIDTLNLSLLGIEGIAPLNGYTFASATGLHNVESKFSWNPDCSIFRDTTYRNDYKLKFLVANNHCKSPITDTAFVNLTVKDIKSVDKGFAPANVITTYPDHCNDFFAIEGFESEPDCNGAVRNIPLVPVDNCANRFERVKIYDRWGKSVFESDDRKFRWYASNESAGVYYYIIYFTNKEYKSSLTVMH